MSNSDFSHRDECEPALACDCPSNGEVLAEIESELEALEAGGETAPWLTRKEAIFRAREDLAIARARN